MFGPNTEERIEYRMHLIAMVIKLFYLLKRNRARGYYCTIKAASDYVRGVIGVLLDARQRQRPSVI